MREPDNIVTRDKEKIPSAQCPLCGGPANSFLEIPNRTYHQCECCLGVFLDRTRFIPPESEKRRYEEHNNNVDDPGYQKFVEPITYRVQKMFGKERKGLDYGAGTGPVAAKLLRDKGYSIELYDPYFWNNPAALELKYDFIICCEVIEHFHSPAKEFKRLRSLLKSTGVLFCMTDLFSENTDFERWYYKNDPTHVFFYQKSTLAKIKSQFGFSALRFEGRLAQYFG